MGLNFNIGLPGPFSYSARIPGPGSVARSVDQLAKANRRLGSAGCSCQRRPAPRSAPRFVPLPPPGLTAGQAARLKAQREAAARGEPQTAAGAWLGVIALVVALVVLFGVMLAG